MQNRRDGRTTAAGVAIVVEIVFPLIAVVFVTVVVAAVVGTPAGLAELWSMSGKEDAVGRIIFVRLGGTRLRHHQQVQQIVK